MRRKTLLLLLKVSMLLLLLWPGISARAAESPDDILVIVNRSNPVHSVDLAELKRMYLGKVKLWGHAKRVFPINAPGGTMMRVRFRAFVLNMSEDEERRYWQNRAGRLEGQKPREIHNVLKTVFHVSGAVGYLRRSDFRAGLAKVVLVIPYLGQ